MLDAMLGSGHYTYMEGRSVDRRWLAVHISGREAEWRLQGM